MVTGRLTAARRGPRTLGRNGSPSPPVMVQSTVPKERPCQRGPSDPSCVWGHGGREGSSGVPGAPHGPCSCGWTRVSCVPLSQPGLDCTQVQGRSSHTHTHTEGLWLESSTGGLMASWLKPQQRACPRAPQHRTGSGHFIRVSLPRLFQMISRPVISFISTWGNIQSQCLVVN